MTTVDHDRRENSGSFEERRDNIAENNPYTILVYNFCTSVSAAVPTSSARRADDSLSRGTISASFFFAKRLECVQKGTPSS